MNNLLNLVTAGFEYLTGSGDGSDSHSPQRNQPRQPRQSLFNSTLASNNSNADYTPSYADICIARAMLKSLKLPTELVLEILAYAKYEPVITFASGSRAVLATAYMGSANSAQTCLRAEILSVDTIRRISGPHVTPRVKEIKFDFASKDQGWTSENTRGTYNTSSWLEVSIFRPNSPSTSVNQLGNIDQYDGLHAVQDHLTTGGYGKLVDERPEQAAIGAQGGEPPLAWYLQGNKVCERENCNYQVVWASDRTEGNEGSGSGEGFLDALKEGDSMFVWARAKVSNSFIYSDIYSRLQISVISMLTVLSIQDGDAR